MNQLPETLAEAVTEATARAEVWASDEPNEASRDGWLMLTLCDALSLDKLARAYDPEAFVSRTFPDSPSGRVGSIQWAARQHLALEAAKRVLRSRFAEVDGYWQIAAGEEAVGGSPMTTLDLDAPCIPWAGKVNGSGYGSCWRTIDGTTYNLAHRAAWAETNGAIPEGMTIDHLCQSKTCVNVAHMELVTRGENSRRAGGLEKATADKRAATHCKHGHEFTEENTYWDARERRACIECRRTRSREWARNHAVN